MNEIDHQRFKSELGDRISSLIDEAEKKLEANAKPGDRDYYMGRVGGLEDVLMLIEGKDPDNLGGDQ